MLRQTERYRTLEKDLMDLQERKLFEYFIVVALHKAKAGVPYLPEVTQQFPLKVKEEWSDTLRKNNTYSFSWDKCAIFFLLLCNGIVCVLVVVYSYQTILSLPAGEELQVHAWGRGPAEGHPPVLLSWRQRLGAGGELPQVSPRSALLGGLFRKDEVNQSGRISQETANGSAIFSL